MTEHYEHVVIGGGPMGAAAAKYLAASAASVLLVAAPEPAGHGQPGLHGSHNDVSRLARGLDSSEVWAKMARLSIARYRDLERQSGIPFFTEAGCVTVLDCTTRENAAKAVELQEVGAKEGVRSTVLDSRQLRERFPAIEVAEGNQGHHEPTAAGRLNPRDYVRAQIAAGRQSGLTVWADVMTSSSVTSRGVKLTTANGRHCSADRVLFAMGAHSLFDIPVPVGEKLFSFARTVVRVELDAAQLEELAGLPSMIVRGANDDENCYVVPPMEYPDGKHYIKIGGGRRAQAITSRSQLDHWYSGDGDPALAGALLQRLEELLPASRPRMGISQACAITVTASGLPMIEKLHPNVGILTGGNGHAAKSGDEAGRLGAQMMLGNDRWSEGYEMGVFAGSTPVPAA